jgi:hypothetical protein
MHFHQIYDIVCGIVVGASVLYMVLPPVESFAQWPKFQSAYSFALIFLKALAVNGRTAVSKLYGTDITATQQAGTKQ